jgi:hypothetical protein
LRLGDSRLASAKRLGAVLVSDIDNSFFIGIKTKYIAHYFCFYLLRQI